MIEILEVLKKAISVSILTDFKKFTEQFPPNSSWYLLSDYCLDDKGKTNDVWTFSVLLNHDGPTKIKEYIRQHAPKDLKSTRTVNEGFLSYLNLPLVFHFSFMLRKSDKFLVKAIDVDKMTSLIKELRDLTVVWENNAPDTESYWSSVRRRIDMFLYDASRSGFNQKLGRQVFLTSLFASTVSYHLWLFNAEPHIAWVSDRDSRPPAKVA